MASVRKRVLESEKVVWLVDFKDTNGVRRAKQFSTRKAAMEWRDKTGVDIRSGVFVSEKDSITVKQAGKLWIETVKVERERRPITVKQYREHLYNHICDPEIGIGNIKLSNLTSSRVKKFYQDTIKLKTRPIGDRALKSLKSLISEAQIQGKVIVNPALPVKPVKKQTKNKSAKIPALADVKKLMENSPDHLWKPLVYVATLCGLRAGELRALSWTDINLTKNTITVSRAADIFRNIYPPKSSAGQRSVPIPEIVQLELKKWKLGCPSSDENLVFPNKVRKVLAHNAIHQNLWRKIMPKLSLVDQDNKPLFRFHDLRHVAASLYIKSDVNPKRLAVIMGHSSIKITFDLYGHLWDDPEGDKILTANVEKHLAAG